ncbi:hypothetical protein Q8A67_014165 [Cirrhinus molitorella]|uniref:Uncharacterized protein n=1 Tax=Cirrhinus molitorella TaxID=172907 RepID=A0AA88TJH0_9TELE|nr:hypothetical protein Q8A67_014165 [Cirrhinus molitorella]
MPSTFIKAPFWIRGWSPPAALIRMEMEVAVSGSLEGELILDDLSPYRCYSEVVLQQKASPGAQPIHHRPVSWSSGRLRARGSPASTTSRTPHPPSRARP